MTISRPRPAVGAGSGFLQGAQGLPFVNGYNEHHHHTGIGLLTPSDLHHGRAPERLKARGDVLGAAHAAHPERFVRGRPRVQDVPREAWINPPRPASPMPPLAAGAQESIQ